MRDYKRSIAVKYITNVFVKTKLLTDKITVQYQEGWTTYFSFGEMNIVYIIREKLLDKSLYEENTGLPKQECVRDLINEINMGLWDAYLDWAYEAFANVQTQKNFASIAIKMMSANQSVVSTPPPSLDNLQIESSNEITK